MVDPDPATPHAASPEPGSPEPGSPDAASPHPGSPPPERAAGRVKAVLWDIGGVFLDWNPRNLYRKLFGDDVAGMEDFLAHVCTPAWHEEQDLGKPIDQACTELAAEHPGQASLIRAWADRNEEMVRGPIEPSVGLLSEVVATGVSSYALTNMEREAFERRLRLYEFFELFDGYFVSALEGVGKPDPRFFKLALERYGLLPEEALFTDDKMENVAAATGLGLPAVVFSGAAPFREELVSRGVLL
jgi:2-haloacid dehalogenase